MKKLILLFAVAAAASTTGCAKVDYGCRWDFYIVNKTGVDIIMLQGDVEDMYIHYRIEPEEVVSVYDISTMCSRNAKPNDLLEFDELLQWQYIVLKVNDNTVSEDILKRVHWDFVSKPHHATYTLNITDELINSVGFEENE